MSAELIVTIGASAGGVTELQRMFDAFPQTTTIAFFVVVHVSPTSESLLPRILSSVGHLPAEHVTSRRSIEAGRIYVAPPDYHLLIDDGVTCVNHAAKENRQRPGINPLFRSAAHAYRDRVIGVILSGMLDDGVAGLSDIREHGGLVIVQDPMEAPYPDMPRNALAALEVDICAPIEDIRQLLIELSGPDGGRRVRKLLQGNSRRTKMTAKSKSKKAERIEMEKATTVEDMLHSIGSPSGFVCPECKGPLWEMRNGQAMHYRCLVGHDYSPNNLSAAYGEELETLLWKALRSLEERIELQKRLAQQAGKGKQQVPQNAFRERVGQNKKLARQIKKILDQLKT